MRNLSRCKNYWPTRRDLTDLREAVRVEAGAPAISLETLKAELGV